MEFPFRKLLKCRHALEPLAWWEGIFGKAFPSVQPFLIPCPASADFFPCPDNPTVRMSINQGVEVPAGSALVPAGSAMCLVFRGKTFCHHFWFHGFDKAA